MKKRNLLIKPSRSSQKNNLTTLEKKILAKVAEIPSGKLITYKILAKAIGKSKAIRPVANALGKNPNLIKTPCHRVVKSNSEAGGYRLGSREKIRLLKKEGIEFERQKIKNLKKYLHKF